jgi:mannose-6-phosphate isomerase-like protein (cupin superfamily)
MADHTAKSIDDMEAAFGGSLVKARAELGVTSFGVQIVRLPPDYADYPEHDHAADGQEEVYMALSGSGQIEVEGERIDLTPDMLVRVGPDCKRKIFPGSEGLSLIAIGGVPGKAYEASGFSELSAG